MIHPRRILACALVLALLGGCQGQSNPPVLYQVSTIQALQEAAYEGVLPVGDLTAYGDFGLGTFDRMDGEMVVLDGSVYQVTSAGRVVRQTGQAVTTPFATVVFFRPTQRLFLPGRMDLERLCSFLDGMLPTPNVFYAVRIDGTFEYVRTRSVRAQAPPFPRMADVVKTQAVFELRQVKGTLVALRCPPYAAGLNMPGWHLHFLADDRGGGGHVLEVRLSSLTAQLQTTRCFHVVLPSAGRFVQADLSRDRSAELKAIEGK